MKNDYVFPLLIVSIVSVTAIPALGETQPPQEQQQFCALVASYRQSQTQYVQEANAVRKAAMPLPNPLRSEQEVRILFDPHHQFRDWTGTLRFSVVGKTVALSFFPDCPGGRPSIQFGNRTASPSGLTRGMPLEDLQTIVPLTSTIAATLLRANSSAEHARVTGNLVPSPVFVRLNFALSPNRAVAQRTYYKSRAGSGGASVANPNYLARFTTVELIAPTLNPRLPSGETKYNHGAEERKHRCRKQPQTISGTKPSTC